MKLYKYITVTLISVLCAFCGYGSINSLSVDSHMYFVLSICCLLFVFLADSKRASKKKRTKNAKV